MFYSFLFLFLFAVFGFVEAEDNNCGISPSIERYKIFNQNKIFGGENSNEFDFPWYVWMYGGERGCSGTILNEKWILTAAHCVNGTDSVNVYYGSVKWEIMKTNSIKGLQYFVHPGYIVPQYDNDIALIELNGTLEFNERVQPICLDSSVEPNPNEILTQIGMGSDFLKTNAPIQHKNMSFCGEGNVESIICVGGVNHASLPGDSGGPLMAIRDDPWVEIGVASTFIWDPYQNESISITVKVYYGSVKWEIMKTKSIKGLQYFVHLGYIVPQYDNDIALIELNGTLEFNERVQPICLDSSVEPNPNEILTQIGMGSDFLKNNGTHISRFSHYNLQDAPIQHKNMSFCGEENVDSIICVDGVNHASLAGDSGGLLMAIRNDRWVEIGVASTFIWDPYQHVCTQEKTFKKLFFHEL